MITYLFALYKPTHRYLLLFYIIHLLQLKVPLLLILLDIIAKLALTAIRRVNTK